MNEYVLGELPSFPLLYCINGQKRLLVATESLFRGLMGRARFQKHFCQPSCINERFLCHVSVDSDAHSTMNPLFSCKPTCFSCLTNLRESPKLRKGAVA